MELIERAGHLALLQSRFSGIEQGGGHCVFVSGEAGIGKTSLVKAFREQNTRDCLIYQGACDALFTPRPLAPLYDIIWQVNSALCPRGHTMDDRSELFTAFFREISNQKRKTIIVFEDIHWADEATLDFISFFARRISPLRCLFILTYREDEIPSRHPLKNVLGQLPPDLFSRLKLTPLSREAVEKMAAEKDYNGEDVYSLTGGNPFYVTEILTNYNSGLPENVRDSILSVYNRQDEKTKYTWQILSILPTGFNIKYLEKTEPSYAASIQKSLETKILVLQENILFFKHELYRRTIEASLSQATRICFNKKMLEVFMESYEANQEIERIVHHAKNADEYEMVVHYAPLAARKAASLGAHIEAAKLYLTAIEFYRGDDKDLLVQFYEAYAYECHLTNQIGAAIVYTEKCLAILRDKDDHEKLGNSLRFLSRLWWFEGNRRKAESFAQEAIEVLDSQPSSRVKAMAYSNISQLKMLSDHAGECISWGEKAIAIATEMNDTETLVHALTNVGSALMLNPTSMQKGIVLLEQSLDLALKNGYHEQVARVYATMVSDGVIIKDYAFANKKLDEGINYCEERDLDSLKLYMSSWKARLSLETGHWKEAYSIAENLLKNDIQPAIVKMGSLAVLATIKMRRGDADALPLLLEAQTKAFEAMELQRIIPALVGLLEYEWLTGKIVIPAEDVDRTTEMIRDSINTIESNEFAFWLLKARKQHLPLRMVYEGYDVSSIPKAQKAAALWERLGCPYAQAFALFEGNDDDKKRAIVIVQSLGAGAVFEKMKREMRTSGIKSIPRGIRRATQANPAFLTGRELDVLRLLKEDLQNKEIAARLFISAKTVDHHISSILFKLDVNSRTKAVTAAVRKEILK